MIKICGFCKHWRVLATSLGFGQCHRYPPDSESRWPLSQRGTVCGEFAYDCEDNDDEEESSESTELQPNTFDNMENKF